MKNVFIVMAIVVGVANVALADEKTDNESMDAWGRGQIALLTEQRMHEAGYEVNVLVYEKGESQVWQKAPRLVLSSWDECGNGAMSKLFPAKVRQILKSAGFVQLECKPNKGKRFEIIL